MRAMRIAVFACAAMMVSPIGALLAQNYDPPPPDYNPPPSDYNPPPLKYDDPFETPNSGTSPTRPTAPLFTIAPQTVRDMMGTWRGRAPTGSPGAFRDVGLELKLKDEATVSVVYIWGAGSDPKDDPPGIASGEGQINFDGTVDFKFTQTPPFEVTLVMTLDPPDQLIVLWNELDTDRLRLRRARMNLRRVGS